MITVMWNPGDWKRAERQMRKATQKAVTNVATETARKANELVPFDTGNLARSRVIKYPLVAQTKIRATIAYGGTAAAYAVVQHEDESLYHPAKARGGTGPVAPGTGRGPKYLEWPMHQLHGVIGEEIAKEIKKFVR